MRVYKKGGSLLLGNSAIRRFSQKVQKSSLEILNIEDYQIDTSENLSMTTFGSEIVRVAQHDVWMAGCKSDFKKYAVKFMNKAWVGFEQCEESFNAQESRQQAVLEVLAMKIGGILCPGQFAKGEVASGGDEKYYIVTEFVGNAISVRALRAEHNMTDRDESIFYLGKVDNADRTMMSFPEKYQIGIDDHRMEWMNLPDEMKEARDDYTITNALVSGRISLKIAHYILGEVEEVENKDGNILMSAVNYLLDHENKLVTALVRPIAIDCGLCFGHSEPTGDLVHKAFKFAVRTSDSHDRMGLELDGKPPTNLKKVKDEFLANIVKICESPKLAQIYSLIDQASEFLDDAPMAAVNEMGNRLKMCYLAGKCIEAGLDDPGREIEAKALLEQLNSQDLLSMHDVESVSM